jgi:hypothetical protein
MKNRQYKNRIIISWISNNIIPDPRVW